MNKDENCRIETDMDINQFLKVLKKIAATEKYLETLQFKGDYKYKGIIEKKHFELRAIYSSYRVPTPTYKGKISLNSSGRVVIDLSVDNPGVEVMAAFFMAFFCPMLFIGAVLTFIFSDNYIVVFILMLFSAAFGYTGYKDSGKSSKVNYSAERFKKELLEMTNGREVEIK
jgi:hypothetical protein